MMKSKVWAKEVFIERSKSDGRCPIVVCDCSLAEWNPSHLGSRLGNTPSASPLKNMQGGNLSIRFAEGSRIHSIVLPSGCLKAVPDRFATFLVATKKIIPLVGKLALAPPTNAPSEQK